MGYWKKLGFKNKKAFEAANPQWTKWGVRPREWTSLHVPGYNYLGPGNAMDDYFPVDLLDFRSYKHDGAYQKLGNPYFHANQADRDMADEVRNEPGVMNRIVENVWDLKGRIAPEMKTPDTLEKEKRKHLPNFDPPKAKKRLRMGDHSTTSMGTHTRFDDDHRRPEPQTEHPSDAPGGDMTMATARGATATPRGLGQETGVDQGIFTRAHPFPDTLQAHLPYEAYRVVTTDAAGFGTFALRLNSIQDLLADFTPAVPSEVSVPLAADAADATLNRPLFRDFYAQIYKYYHVVTSSYSVTFYPTTKLTGVKMDIFQYRHGNQQPPAYTSGTTPVPRVYRAKHRNCSYQVLEHDPTTNTDDNAFDNYVTFSGTYNDTDRHLYNQVAEDELAETWHLISAVPPAREGLVFMVQPSLLSHTGGSVITYNVHVKLDLVVQFKDLVVALDYPTNESDMTFTNFAVQSN